MPRGIFSADPTILSECLGESIEDLDLAIEEALGALARFSLIRLTPETVSVHRLLQAVEQDALTKEACARWLEWAVRLFNAFAPAADDARTWNIWLALRPHAEALIKHTQTLGMDTLPVGQLTKQFAWFLSVQANYMQAEPLMRRALAINEASFGLDHPNVTIDLNNLAQLLQATNRLSEAEPLMRRALAIFEKALGPEHPNAAITLDNLAGLYQTQGQYAKAEPLFERALAIAEKALSPEHSHVAWSLDGLARIHTDQGQYPNAAALYQRSLAIRERALGLEHPDVAWSLNGLAGLSRLRGKLEKAESLFERALEIRETFWVSGILT
jgi:tetratricopeptide (TPR) repeat protein